MTVDNDDGHPRSLRNTRLSDGGEGTNVAGEPFARLPDRVVLRRDEVAIILFALDSVEELSGIDTATRQQLATARILLTSKLWRELGDLLGDGEEE